MRTFRRPLRRRLLQLLSDEATSSGTQLPAAQVPQQVKGGTGGRGDKTEVTTGKGPGTVGVGTGQWLSAGGQWPSRSATPASVGTPVATRPGSPKPGSPVVTAVAIQSASTAAVVGQPVYFKAPPSEHKPLGPQQQLPQQVPATTATTSSSYVPKPPLQQAPIRAPTSKIPLTPTQLPQPRPPADTSVSSTAVTLQLREGLPRGKGPLPRPSDTQMSDAERTRCYELAIWRLQQRGKDHKETEPFHLAFHGKGAKGYYWETPYGVRSNPTGG